MATTPHAGGFLVALEDRGSGKANVNERFGETVQTGGAGGTGIGMYKASIYAEINDQIVRYALPAGSIVPRGPADTIVSGLPLGGDHPMHPFIIDPEGSMYVECQRDQFLPAEESDTRIARWDPCTELETRGGIWRYDANRTNQTFSPANASRPGSATPKALPSTRRALFVTQHGRDQLHANWPDSINPNRRPHCPPKNCCF